MNNELICTPVMLPMPPQAIGNCLVKDNTGRIFRSAGESERSYATRVPQHLYLVSDEEIKVGDWILHKSPEYEKVQTGWELHRYSNPHGSVATTDWRKKIIATTNKSLSLPLIPNSFIEEYVQKQGKIDKVRVEMHFAGIGDFKESKPLLNEGEVIILPIEDKTCSRKEMKDAVEAYREYVVRTGLLDAPSFQAWFDLNY